MSGSGAARARLERATAAAGRVEAAVRAWVGRRRKRDRDGLHRAQLAALEGVLLGAVARIAEAAGLSEGMEAGALHREAAALEGRLAVVEKVFEVYGGRFDQRDAEPHGALLEVADEVVRSLYLPPLRAAGGREAPMPLAYVEPVYSPHAFTREEPPAEWKTSDRVVHAALGRVPFGMVSVPPWFAEGPWTLVLLAHELGHHLQVDLSGGPALARAVREALKEAAVGAGVPGDGSDFFAWGNEVFADAFAIAAVGPVAVDALAELDRTDDAGMVAQRPRYPSPAVRVALMREVAKALGVDASGMGGVEVEALVGRDPAARSEAQARAAGQVEGARAVAAALAGLPLAGGRALGRLCDVRPADFAPGGEVELWRDALLAGKKRARDATLRGTRRVLAGAWLAWRKACAIEDRAARAEAIAAVRERAVKALAENREPVTLAGAAGEGASAADGAARGRDLGDFLAARSLSELQP